MTRSLLIPRLFVALAFAGSTAAACLGAQPGAPQEPVRTSRPTASNATAATTSPGAVAANPADTTAASPATSAAATTRATPTTTPGATPARSSATPRTAAPTRVAAPTTAPTPTAAPTVRPAPVTPAPSVDPADLEPFALKLHRDGDYVRQFTVEWCVGASLQMTLNMVLPENDRSRDRQQELWEMARDRSFSPFGGANPRGWTAALNELGVGRYTLVSLPTFDEALRVAARALRETKRPVGLVMWRGRHAWVMSGFTSLGDPGRDEGFRVTGINVMDPLYPRGSRAWGRSPRPGALVTPATLARQFVIRDRSRVNVGVPPGFLLVLPTA